MGHMHPAERDMIAGTKPMYVKAVAEAKVHSGPNPSLDAAMSTPCPCCRQCRLGRTILI